MRRRNGGQHLAAQARTPLGVVLPTVPAGGLRGAARGEERCGGGASKGGREAHRADRGTRADRDETRSIQPCRGRSDSAAIPPRMPHRAGIVDRRSGLRTVGHWRARAHSARGSAPAHVAETRTTHRWLTRSRNGARRVVAAACSEFGSTKNRFEAPPYTSHPRSQTLRENPLWRSMFYDVSLRPSRERDHARLVENSATDRRAVGSCHLACLVWNDA